MTDREKTMVEQVTRFLDRTGVPANCDLRAAGVALAQVFDGDDRAGHMAPASAALIELMAGVREIYRETTPLEDERDLLRARREARELGIDLTDEGDTNG